jgi:hypothetical protein
VNCKTHYVSSDGYITLNQERYAEIFGEFETLLRVGTDVSNRLVGTTPTERHLSYADSIYTKLLCHAVSLHKLSPQIENKPEHELWDLPSACAIARCVIETHDVLGYMVFSAASAEERDFRLLLWRLHDQQRRSKMLHSIESKDPRAEEIHVRAKALNDETLNHPWFPRVAKNLQSKIKSGDAPAFLLSQRELNEANSVNHEYYTSATMWLSQYVHTYPMSIHQLSEFRAGTADALHISSMPVQYTLGFLAISITKMAETFSQAKMELSDANAALFSRWCTVVEDGVTTASWKSK